MNAETRVLLAEAAIFYILAFFLGALLAWVRVAPPPAPPLRATPLSAQLESSSSRNAAQLNAAQAVIAVVRQKLATAQDRLPADPRLLAASHILSESVAAAGRAKTSLLLNDQDATATLIQRAFNRAESAEALIRSVVDPK